MEKTGQTTYNWKLLLLGIFLLAITLRASPDTSYFFWDEAIYLMHAQDFKEGNAVYTDHDVRPPLVPFVLSYLPQSENIYRIFMALINSLLVLVAFLFAREISVKAGLIAAFLVALLPFHIIASRWIMTDALATLFMALAAFFYWKGKTRLLYLGGVFFWLSLLTKFTSFVFLPVYVIVLILNRKKITKHHFLSLLLTALITTPYLIFNYNLFGNVLHPIITAFFVVQESNPAGLYFTLFSLIDFFGIILLFFLLSRKKLDNYKLFLFGWAAVSILYYAFILQRGVAKPPTIEWEAERFLLPAMIPVIVLAAGFLSKLKKSMMIAALILVVLLSLFYVDRITTPAIEQENGLRQATKEMGQYIQENIPPVVIYCMGNCPVMAYYSEHRIRIAAYTNFQQHIADVPDGAYLVVLTAAEEEFNLTKIKTISAGDWTETLYLK